VFSVVQATEDLIMPEDILQDARRLIEHDSVQWYDFCANIGQIPGNLPRSRKIVEEFARWLISEGF